MRPTLPVSPLSPERAWHMSSSRTFTRSRLGDDDVRLHGRLLDKGRPVGNYFARLGPPPGKSCHSGRPHEYQGCDFLPESFDSGTIEAPGADAKHDLVDWFRERG